MEKISENMSAASCSRCFAQGQLPGRFCRGFDIYGQQHAVGEFVGRRRQVSVDDKHGYCRLCRAQATWAIKARGDPGANRLCTPVPSLARRRSARLPRGGAREAIGRHESVPRLGITEASPLVGTVVDRTSSGWGWGFTAAGVVGLGVRLLAVTGRRAPA
ncbi:hypothetical protein [Streptomyces sp. NPDC055709]